MIIIWRNTFLCGNIIIYLYLIAEIFKWDSHSQDGQFSWKKNHKKAKILFITKAKSKIERIKRGLILDPSESEERKIKKDFKKNL